MPNLTVGGRTVEVAEGTRLVLAIESMGVHIGHRCGGKARCTTCRVVFTAGEPDTMTAAEYERLQDVGIYGEYRLSCQIACTHDMACEPAMTLENQGWSDTGPEPATTIEPPPEFMPRPA